MGNSIFPPFPTAEVSWSWTETGVNEWKSDSNPQIGDKLTLAVIREMQKKEDYITWAKDKKKEGKTDGITVVDFAKEKGYITQDEALCEWQEIRRGDKIPPNAVKGGQTKTDGEKGENGDNYVGRSPNNQDGMAGKINVDADEDGNSTMWNFWAHGLGKTDGTNDKQKVGILVLKPEVTVNWKPITRSDPLPECQVVLAGVTDNDGPTYVGRGGPYAKGFEEEVGKINTEKEGSVMWNYWGHGYKDSLQTAEVLCLSKQATATKPRWVGIKKGEVIPPHAVCAGESEVDKSKVYVGRRSDKGEMYLGKINVEVEAGTFCHFWTHGTKNSFDNAEILCLDEHDWIDIEQKNEIPANAVLGGDTKKDGPCYVGRNKPNEAGKLNVKVDADGKKTMWRFWAHHHGCSTTDVQILVTKAGGDEDQLEQHQELVEQHQEVVEQDFDQSPQEKLTALYAALQVAIKADDLDECIKLQAEIKELNGQKLEAWVDLSGDWLDTTFFSDTDGNHIINVTQKFNEWTTNVNKQEVRGTVSSTLSETGAVESNDVTMTTPSEMSGEVAENKIDWKGKIDCKNGKGSWYSFKESQKFIVHHRQGPEGKISLRKEPKEDDGENFIKGALPQGVEVTAFQHETKWVLVLYKANDVNPKFTNAFGWIDFRNLKGL